MSAPTRLDGATVLATARLDIAQATGNTRHLRDGGLANARITRLAIARYEDQSGVYVFYCDDDWSVVTDTFHDEVDGARNQARFEFGDLGWSDLDTLA